MNSESSNPEASTLTQLQEARLKRWHQTGEALLTLENMRSWINAAGLVLFIPRPQVVAPAPTFVEAVLGAPNSEPTLQEIAEARRLLARLIAEGVALPLNLMGTHGTPGDTPDFVVSAAVFPYIFTLRGDKAWKQPPEISGPTKVSNLALASFEALSSNGPTSAYDLATQLGKEVTETACLRALNELWTHLRVIPVIQPDERGTQWELTSSRFTKQIKAGANAGQPTALSALTSLYLGQAISASEGEIESFLSPLAPRSRIRDVIHALLGARQLDTVVVEGKTLLHIGGEAPSFATETPVDAAIQAESASAEGEGGAESGDASRIKKYVPRPRKIGTGYLGKGKPVPGKRPFAGSRGPDSRAQDSRGRSARPGQRADGRDERERRPFRKPVEGAPDRPFRKPVEGAPDRPFRKPVEGAPDRPFRKPAEARSDRPFRKRTEGGSSRPFQKPAEGTSRRFDRPWEDDRPRRSAERGGKPPRRTSSEGQERSTGRAPFRSGPRPPRRDGDRPDRRPRRDDQGTAERRPRRENGGSFESRPRREQDRAPMGRPFQKRPERRDRDDRPPRERREGSSAGNRPPFRRFDAPRRDAGARPPRRDSGGPGGGSASFERRAPRQEGGQDRRPPRRDAGSSEGRPAKKYGGEKRPSGKPKFGGGGKFSKPPAKGKPFAKRPSDKKSRPKRDDSA